MSYDNKLILLGAFLIVVLQFNYLDSKIETLKVQNDALIKIKEEQTEALLKTQDNILEAYLLGSRYRKDNK